MTGTGTEGLMNPWDADTFQPLGQVVQGFLEAGSPVGERCPLLAPPSSGHSLRALALLRQTAALRKSARQVGNPDARTHTHLYIYMCVCIYTNIHTLLSCSCP